MEEDRRTTSKLKEEFLDIIVKNSEKLKTETQKLEEKF